jgi:hypothetical protein
MREFRKCHDNFCMTPDSFRELHDTLVRYHGLRSTQEVESCEALGMFLWACGTQQATRQIRDRFERSLDTIHRKMAMVADALYGFAQTIKCPKDPTFSKVHNKLRPYAPFFHYKSYSDFRRPGTAKNKVCAAENKLFSAALSLFSVVSGRQKKLAENKAIFSAASRRRPKITLYFRWFLHSR